MKIQLERSVLLRPSFAQLFFAESHVFHSCVCFWFLGLEQFSLLQRFLAFETLLFQLLKVNRELAYFIPLAK